MKRILILITTVTVLLSLTASCSKKDEMPTSKDKILLQYKFKKGDKFQYKLTTNIIKNQSLKADSLMQSNISQTDTYVFDFEVMDVDSDKIAELTATITSINVDIDRDGQKLNFDPSKNPSQEDQKNFLQYAAPYNIPFRARVNASGEVIEVSHLDKIVDKALAIIPPSQEITAQQKNNISQELRDGMIHPVIQLIFRELPQQEVAKDSTWQKNYPGEISVFKVSNTAKFTLNDFVKVKDENAAKVNVKLDVSWEGEKSGVQNGVKYNFEDPSITGDGQYIFNIDRGLLVKSETTTNIKLVAHIEGRNNLQKTTKGTQTDISTNKNTIELL